MCGIAGVIRKNHLIPDEGLLMRLSDSIGHRGPDAHGEWKEPGVGLVHRRLSIIDVSSTGAQPMRDAREELVIVFNGEIYNYRELRETLTPHVGRWRSGSDTEVILEGYRYWGKDVLHKLRGMFAFAIWDRRTDTLLLARDRIGKKPLYLAEGPDGGLVFGSELAAIRVVMPLEPSLDDIRTFLGLQYVPAPQTGYVGVRSLCPGEYALYSRGELEVRSYASWCDVATERRDAMKDAVPEQIDTMIRTDLEEAVRVRQLASDVPVGAFLSGGIDSAAVVAYASQHVDRLSTFTMGFAEPGMDERTQARAIAARFNTDHHEFEATPNALLDIADALIDRYDAPYADSSALPLWLLARETSKEIKVVLTGDGGDEVFGGYRRYVAYQRALAMTSFPGGALVTMPLLRLAGLYDSRLSRMGQTIEGFRYDAARAYAEMFCGSYFNTRELAKIAEPAFLQETSLSDAVAFVAARIRGCGESDPLAAAMLFDLTSYLPDDLNVKMDRASMAFGLEARSPFLDQYLVTNALGIPLSQKVAHGQTKIALRRALRGVVPADVLGRPKRGFQVPLAVWFRGPLRSAFKERCLTPSPLHAYLRPDAIARLEKENARGVDHGNKLWMLYSLATWLAARHVPGQTKTHPSLCES